MRGLEQNVGVNYPYNVVQPIINLPNLEVYDCVYHLKKHLEVEI
jgi:hypothetical protein